MLDGGGVCVARGRGAGVMWLVPAGPALRVVFWAGVEEQKIEQANVDAFMAAHPGVAAVMLGITFKGQNVAYMVSLAFAIAASELPTAKPRSL